MNRTSIAQRIVLITCGIVSAAAPLAAQAEFKCDQPQLARVDATACALGARDVASLRRYVTLTKPIYGLQMKDYVRFVGDEPQAAPVPAARVTPSQSVAGAAPPAR